MELIIIVLVIAVILIISNIKIVPQAHAYIVERLGAYKETWSVGLHLKVPFIDKISKKVSIKEQVVDFDPQPVITKDNVSTILELGIGDGALSKMAIERWKGAHVYAVDIDEKICHSIKSDAITIVQADVLSNSNIYENMHFDVAYDKSENILHKSIYHKSSDDLREEIEWFHSKIYFRRKPEPQKRVPVLTKIMRLNIND